MAAKCPKCGWWTTEDEIEGCDGKIPHAIIILDPYAKVEVEVDDVLTAKSFKFTET